MKSKLLLATSIFTLSMLYGCLDEVTEASAPDVSELACKTEPLDDDSGLKVICGGDSVGVVLNGKDGKDGKDGEDGKSGADGKTKMELPATSQKTKKSTDTTCSAAMKKSDPS